MKKSFRQILVVLLLTVSSVGAFAQKKEPDKRPPKEPGKVVAPDKREPPPQNSNRPKEKPKKP
jgi:hypothetical protein